MDASSDLASDADSDSIWPTRWGDDPEHRGVIIDLDPNERFRPAHYSRFHKGRSTPGDYEDAAKLASAMGIERGFKFKPEGPGSFVFIPDIFNTSPVNDPPAMRFKFVSARLTQPEESTLEPDEDHVELERTWFTYRDPKPGTPVLGTMVILPGMFGTPEPIVDATERYFTHRGFAVLRMLSQPSRFTQHTLFTYLDGRGDALAKQIARVADERIAECAYSTDAALDHVLEARPDLRDKPVVLLGMSGGAMSLPTVFAYDPDRYDAAVLIAGGADFLRIMIDSNYRDWIDAILIDFDPMSDTLGQPDPGVEESLCERYLEDSKLDAYHTALGMRDTPTLVLHATKDKAVPAATGDLLYQQLGKPERWTYPYGHELIFVTLPTQMKKIDAWISEQLGLDSEDRAPSDG